MCDIATRQPKAGSTDEGHAYFVQVSVVMIMAALVAIFIILCFLLKRDHLCRCNSAKRRVWHLLGNISRRKKSTDQATLCKLDVGTQVDTASVGGTSMSVVLETDPKVIPVEIVSQSVVPEDKAACPHYENLRGRAPSATSPLVLYDVPRSSLETANDVAQKALRHIHDSLRSANASSDTTSDDYECYVDMTKSIESLQC